MTNVDINVVMLWFTLKTSGLKFRLWKILKQRECGDAHCHLKVGHLNLFVFNCYGSTFYLSNPSYKSIHGTNQNWSMRLKLQQGLNWKPDKTVHRFQDSPSIPRQSIDSMTVHRFQDSPSIPRQSIDSKTVHQFQDSPSIPRQSINYKSGMLTPTNHLQLLYFIQYS